MINEKVSSDANVIKEALAFVKKKLPSKQEEDQIIEEIQQQGQSEEEQGEAEEDNEDITNE